MLRCRPFPNNFVISCRISRFNVRLPTPVFKTAMTLKRQIILPTPAESSVGEEDADNSESCSKVHRPPRIGFDLRVNTAVVRLRRLWVFVAVDRLRCHERTVARGGEHAAHKGWSVQCHVAIRFTVDCSQHYLSHVTCLTSCTFCDVLLICHYFVF